MLNSIKECLASGKANSHDIAVVIGTYNRSHLLQNSLFFYEAVAQENNYNLALIILDDGSTDYTENLVDIFANKENSKITYYYHKLEDKELGQWRDSAAFLNKGLSFAIYNLNAKYIFATHPEICIGQTTIQDSIKLIEGNNNAFALSKGFYLDMRQQFDFEKFVPFTPLSYILSSFFKLYSIPAFVQSQNDFFSRGDYSHPFQAANVLKTPIWHSWIFGGATAETWKRFKGLPESDKWGSVDVAFMNQRLKYEFETFTPDDYNAIVLHQNHDDPEINVVTPRIEEVWREDLVKNHDKFVSLDLKPNYLSENIEL